MVRLVASRRRFLQSYAIAGVLFQPFSGAAGVARAAGVSGAAGAEELSPKSRSDRRFRIGLSQYSLHRMIKAGKLAALDYPEFAQAQFGIREIDVWEGTFPKDEGARDQHARDCRKRADDAGSRVFLLMAGVVDASQSTSDTSGFLPWLDRARVLGCDFVRVFLRASDDAPEKALDMAASAMAPLSDQAKQRGLSIVIEPGASKLTQQGKWLAQLMQSMKHSNCKLMPDFGKFGSYDIYDGTAAMMPHTKVISAKSHDFRADGQEVRFDYPRLMKIATEADFRGIVAIEYEGSHLDEVAGVKATQRLLTQIRDSMPA